VGLDDDNIAFHEDEFAVIFHLDFPETHPKEGRAPILCINGMPFGLSSSGLKSLAHISSAYSSAILGGVFS